MRIGRALALLAFLGVLLGDGAHAEGEPARAGAAAAEPEATSGAEPGAEADVETAELAEEWSRRAFYLGANGGYAVDLFGSDLRALVGVPGNLESLVTFTDSPGFNVRAGWRALSWLAVEVQYEWIDSIEMNVPTLPAVSPVVTFRPQSITANLRWYVPIRRFQPYFLMGAGVGLWDVTWNPLIGRPRESGTGFAARVGIGLDAWLTDHVALNVESSGVFNTKDFSFTLIGTEVDKLYYFSVSGGLLFRY